MAGVLLSLLTAVVAGLHGWAIWLGAGGYAELINRWPPWRDDHPLYFYYGLITPSYLRRSWTSAGYDPTFMAGYAKSIHFPPSATLAELVMALFGASRPEVVYKVVVVAASAALPWLVWLAAKLWRLGPVGSWTAVSLFLLYVWTDFPLSYVAFGMVGYLLSVPLGLVATGAFVRYCGSGGLFWWGLSAVLMVVCEAIHLTTAMIVVPAAAAVYFASIVRSRTDDASAVFPRSRHVGVGLIPVLVVACNAFWWYPGLLLTSTKGPSGFAFSHPEGVLIRLGKIVTTEPVIEPVLLAAGLVGFLWLIPRGWRDATGLLAFAAAGFGWGYLAGGFRALDFLQPGRHTTAFYTALCVAAGFGVEQVHAVIRQRLRFRVDLVLGAVVLGIGGWVFRPGVEAQWRAAVMSPYPFLSSRPTPRLLWVVSRVKGHVKPGERLLYEEGGFSLEGLPDPYSSGRFSAILPWKCPGIELIGGPYLHAALSTNFTQFGEGKLFGREDWDRGWFERYARLYRPSAILCWTPRSRAFCLANPDLISIKDDDGVLMIGRVNGFEGAAIEGTAEVESRPGSLRLTRAKAGVDGFVVLRYHSVPCLRTDPPVPWESVWLEDDPVPFIKMRPPTVPVTFELKFPPGRLGAPGP